MFGSVSSCLTIFLSCGALLAAAAPRPIRTVAQLNEFLSHRAPATNEFRISASVLYVNHPPRSITIQDGCAQARIFTSDPSLPSPGETVDISGVAHIGLDQSYGILATNICTTGQGQPVPIADIRLSDLDEDLHDRLAIRTTGVVTDAFLDELDRQHTFVLLKDRETTITVSVGKNQVEKWSSLIGAHIRLCGSYEKHVYGSRRFFGPIISLFNDDPHAVEIVTPSPGDPYDVPSLESSYYLTTREVARLSLRKVEGVVVAAWNGGNVLVKESNGRVVNLRLVKNMSAPDNGTSVAAVGYPATDHFHLYLANVRWKAIPPVAVTADVPIPIDLTAGPRGRLPDLTTHNRYQGALIRTVGTVCGAMNDGRKNRCFYMDAGSSRIPVDCSCFPRILEDDLIGCTVEVTGRCQLEMSNRDPQALFPEISGMSVIIGHQGGVRIIARPSWLTPGKLLVAIALLLAALIAIFAWNRVLTRIVTVRSRQLYKAELAQAKSRLRIDERTRLAVELHDTLAQNLTGISLEVQAARAQLNRRPEQTDAHLALAGKSLESCRRELRNCLRDLRNDALEQTDMDKAIRMTLEPHVENTRVSVRFNVPRARLSDNTAHAILRIVRELVLNALRHGKATSVRVAGTLDGSRVSFSVRDDGCGFDPDSHPGAREGHFGLVGIRERVKAFDGKLEIDSRPGGGTKVSVTLHLPRGQDKHEENKDIHR